jgi:hypothetical protein
MKRICLLAAFALLTACTKDPLANYEPPTVRYQLPPGTIEFRLADGTRCVSVNGVAITCEWRPAIQIMPRVE